MKLVMEKNKQKNNLPLDRKISTTRYFRCARDLAGLLPIQKQILKENEAQECKHARKNETTGQAKRCGEVNHFGGWP